MSKTISVGDKFFTLMVTNSWYYWSILHIEKVTSKMVLPQHLKIVTIIESSTSLGLIYRCWWQNGQIYHQHKNLTVICILTPFSATGPALREKIYTMQNLYQKYKSTGLEEAETNNLLQIRKLLQLKTLVTTLLNDNRYFLGELAWFLRIRGTKKSLMYGILAWKWSKS